MRVCKRTHEARYWNAYAVRTVVAHVKLVTEPDTAANLCQLLAASSVGQVRGTERADCVLLLFDPKQSGEAATHPHVRCAPLREDQLAKLPGGVLDARKALQPGAETLIEGDILCLLDGGRHDRGRRKPTGGGGGAGGWETGLARQRRRREWLSDVRRTGVVVLLESRRP